MNCYVGLDVSLQKTAICAVDAAITAGYADSYENAARCARILLRSLKIMKAIKDGVVARFDTAVGAAFNTLYEVCTDKTAPKNARVTAAESILNRSSIGPVPSRSLTVSVTTSVEDLLDQLDSRERAQAARNAQTIDSEALDVAAWAEEDPA